MRLAIERNVVLLSLAQALMMSVNTLLLTASAIIGFELADNKALATLPLALQFLSAMLTTLPASFLMKRAGRKFGFIFSSVMGFLGSFCAIYAVTQHSFVMFCVATLLFGIYTGFGSYYRFAAAEVAAPEHTNKAISYVLAGGVLAALIGPNLANYSKDLLQITYLGTFISVLILYAMNLINFLFMDLPKPINRSLDQYARPLKTIAQQPVFIVALLAAVIGYSMMALLMTATPLAMMHEHMSFGDVAIVIQWHVLGMFVPSFFTGHLIDRIGAPKVIFAGATLMLICIAINLWGVTLAHFWTALLVLGLGWNFMFIGGTALLTRTYNEVEKAKVQALNDFSIFTAVTLASLGAGVLQHQLGWRIVNISVIPFLFISLVSIIWMKHQLKHSLQPG